MMKLPRIALLLSILAALVGSAWAWSPVGPVGKDSGPVPPLRPEAADRFARTVLHAATLISQRYYQEVSTDRLLAAAVASLYRATGTAAPADAGNPPADPLRDVARARLALGKHSALRDEQDVQVAVAGMLASLDPYSVLITPQDLGLQTVRATTEIGLTFEDRPNLADPWIIRGVTPRGPADKAGLKPGDALLAIDGAEPPENLTALALSQSLNGRVQQPRTLRIQPPLPQQPREVLIRYDADFFPDDNYFGVRREVDGGWSFWLDEGRRLAYVRMGLLSGDLHHLLGAELLLLRYEGLKGLIVDLRDCPGGQLNTSAETAGVFLLEQDAVIAKVRYGAPDGMQTWVPNPPPRGLMPRPGEFVGKPTQFLVQFPARLPKDVPIVVLIGPDTMGGGELIAAALQDHRRAILIGQATRGKATVQEVVDDSGLPSFRLSTGLIYRPNGKTYQRGLTTKIATTNGVQPDEGYEVRLPKVLHRQIRRWRHDLERRPPDSRQAQPLDFMENDPVLARALKSFETKGKPQS